MRIWIAAAALGASGCVSSLSTLQTARTQPPGDFEVIAGASIPIHGAFVSEFADAVAAGGDRLEAADSEPLTAEEEREVTEAALAAVLLPPAVVPEIGLRIGVVERVDLGLRLAGPGQKLDAKVNFYRGAGWDLAASLGYVRHSGVGPSVAESAYDLFERLRIVDYSRHDVDAAILLSGDTNEVFSGYGALRYVAGFTSFETRIPDELVGQGAVAETDTDATMHYLGSTGGLRLGSAKFAFLAELTLMYLWFEPTILGDRRDLSGLVVVPALGGDARF